MLAEQFSWTTESNSMKKLIMAVIWCGFMLSFSALATSIDLYVSDPGPPGLKGKILEFTSTGMQSTFASVANPFGVSPLGLAFNTTGDLFAANGDPQGKILELSATPTGKRSIFASGLSDPIGLAFNTAGDLFVSDLGSGRILQFTPAGIESTFASGLDHPYGLAFDSFGNLFEADLDSGNIYEFTASGAKSTFATGLGFAGPAGLAFNSAGDLFVSDSGTILEFTPAGMKSTFASGLPRPTVGLAFDTNGTLFAAAGTDIFQFTPTGVQSTFATGLHGPQWLTFGPASFSVPDSGATLVLLVISTCASLCVRKFGGRSVRTS